MVSRSFCRLSPSSGAPCGSSVFYSLTEGSALNGRDSRMTLLLLRSADMAGIWKGLGFVESGGHGSGGRRTNARRDHGEPATHAQLRDPIDPDSGGVPCQDR
jgi:hypothetical protein